MNTINSIQPYILEASVEDPFKTLPNWFLFFNLFIKLKSKYGSNLYMSSFGFEIFVFLNYVQFFKVVFLLIKTQ